jgi:diguanylate cyclase
LEQLLTASIAKIADLRGRLVKAEQDATRDVLTGLYNRRMFESVLIRTAMQSAEEKSNLSVLLIDIDHFKRFNDTYGHAVGDNVLRLVGRTLLAHVKGRDTAARYGGEEFVILLPGASQSGAISLAEGIRQSLCARPVINRTSNQNLGLVTCSIGVAQFRHDEPAEGMVRRADQALYEAKRSGRNNVRGAT